MVSKPQKKSLLKAASREQRFATLAKKEGKGAAQRAKREHGAMKQDSEWEKRIDEAFVNIRNKRADTFRKKANAKS